MIQLPNDYHVEEARRERERQLARRQLIEEALASQTVAPAQRRYAPLLAWVGRKMAATGVRLQRRMPLASNRTCRTAWRPSAASAAMRRATKKPCCILSRRGQPGLTAQVLAPVSGAIAVGQGQRSPWFLVPGSGGMGAAEASHNAPHP